MRVRVKLFAVLRERAGSSEIALDLPPGATIAAARDAIARERPALAAHLARVAFAVNQSYAKPEALLTDGDELALIPPVSGG
jgi:molybdopterin converting factor subunit 1